MQSSFFWPRIRPAGQITAEGRRDMAQASERRRRFEEEYRRTGDVARAARAAGYSEGYAPRALRRMRAADGGTSAPDRSPASNRSSAPDRSSASNRVASEREVLEFLTDVMRGELESEGKGGAASPRMKAAELLGKRLGAFNESVEALPPVIVDDIPARGGADG